ncbi:hypothetical protein [Microcoleus sp. herbarium5]
MARSGTVCRFDGFIVLFEVDVALDGVGVNGDSFCNDFLAAIVGG